MILFGAMGGGLGILMGGFLRSLRYSGATMYFPLLIYQEGANQYMVDGYPHVTENDYLDYSRLIQGVEDQFEIWEPAVNGDIEASTKSIRFQLQGREIRN